MKRIRSKGLAFLLVLALLFPSAPAAAALQPQLSDIRLNVGGRGDARADPGLAVSSTDHRSMQKEP